MSNSAYHDRRILIQPRTEVVATELQSFHRANRSRVLRVFAGLGNLQVLELPEGETVPEAVARYRQSGFVEFAEPDYRVAAAATFPNDPRSQDGTLWALHNYGQNGGMSDADLDAPEAWDILRSASNVIVAIVDSGIRYTHEDLVANLWDNPQDGSHGFNAITNESHAHDPWDDYGHGTHLAGIIGAAGNNGKGVVGVAWGVQLMACKFLDNLGDGYNSDAVSCIEFARSNGATVINLSWGGTDFSAAVSNAILAGRSEGIIFTAAAGNAAHNNDVTPFFPASIELDNIVAVGASTRQDVLRTSSNYGSQGVDLFAPGQDIYSTSFSADGYYESMSGTSMATAFVSGALALLRQQNPTAAPHELRHQLFTTVDPRPAFSGKCVTGGRLNLLKALEQVHLVADASPCESCPPADSPLPFRLRLAGTPGHAYVVSASEDFTGWQPLVTNTTGPDGFWLFVDEASTNLTKRFYRAGSAP